MYYTKKELDFFGNYAKNWILLGTKAKAILIPFKVTLTPYSANP